MKKNYTYIHTRALAYSRVRAGTDDEKVIYAPTYREISSRESAPVRRCVCTGAFVRAVVARVLARRLNVPRVRVRVAGDEILCVNDEPVGGMTHAQAINCFKKVRQGPLRMEICRRKIVSDTAK